MKSSANCLSIIRVSEGCRLRPYLCPAGVPTIGYGSTRYADGRAVTLADAPITEAQADAIMLATLGEYEAAVSRYVQVPINQNRFDALVDFAYNAGAKNLLTSTLLKLLNAGDYDGAAGQFTRWVFANGQKLKGLETRRLLERQLFLAPPGQAMPTTPPASRAALP